MTTLTRSSAYRVPWSNLLLPWRVWTRLFQYRELIQQFTRREILGRYKGSALGIFWSFLNPLFMLAIYTIVFGFIFQARYGQTASETKMDYALALFCSLNIFHFFAEVVSHAPTLLVNNPNFITKVVFPLEIFGVASIGSAIVHLMISMTPLLIALLLVQGQIHLTALYVLPWLIPLALFSLGITWALSSAGIFLRDINALISPFVLVLLYVSAVFYPIAKVPEQFRWLFALNPLAQIIDQSRKVMVWGMSFDFTLWCVLFLASLIVCHGGYAFFMRAKRLFADRL
ncbi:MAG: ABC transporter permease [bacterium]